MENKEEAKNNILKKVNKKLKRKKIQIAIISISVCVLIALILYGIFFAKQTPISADLFENVGIETKLETIYQLDNKELQYNNLVFTINKNLFYADSHFYIENNDSENTSTLYFYMSENYMAQLRNNQMEKDFTSEGSIDVSILLYPKLCKTDKINEITKIYYLVYNYDNFNKQDFNNAKNEAVLLWEK